MIPKTISDVTPDWLGDVLGASVLQVTATQIGQGIGLMGDIYRVVIEYADSTDILPGSVVVKLPSSFEENRAHGIAFGMFESEVRFYDELSSEASVGIPRVYLATIDPGTADFVIVMEDLSHLTMVDQSVGMSLDQARAAVEVLAQIHAVWWDRVKTPELEWIPTMFGRRIELVDEMLDQIFPVFASRFAESLPEGGIEVYERFSGNFQKVNKALAMRSPWTLAHQDYRVENLLFASADSPATRGVVVLDWQGIGRGPGAYDLAYLLGGSMDTSLRRANEEHLLGTYHDKLLDAGISNSGISNSGISNSGISNYSVDQLWDDYGLAHLMGGLATAMVAGSTMDLSNDRGTRLIASMVERHVTAALDHDGLERLAAVV